MAALRYGPTAVPQGRGAGEPPAQGASGLRAPVSCRKAPLPARAPAAVAKKAAAPTLKAATMAKKAPPSTLDPAALAKKASSSALTTATMTKQAPSLARKAGEMANFLWIDVLDILINAGKR